MRTFMKRLLVNQLVPYANHSYFSSQICNLTIVTSRTYPRLLHTSPIHFKKSTTAQKSKKSAGKLAEPSLDEFEDFLDIEQLESDMLAIEEKLATALQTEVILRPSNSHFENLIIEICESSSAESELVELKMIAQLKSSANEILIEPVDSNDVENIVSALKEFYSQSWPEVDKSQHSSPVIKVKLMRITKQYREQLCSIAKSKTSSSKDGVKKLFDSACKHANKMKNEGNISEDDYRSVHAALIQWNKYNTGKLDQMLSQKTEELMNAT